jgi:hypothetical protein
MNAIFHVDNEYLEDAISQDFKIDGSDFDPNCFRVTIKNVEPNALKVFTDWGDLAVHYGLQYESIVYCEIK